MSRNVQARRRRVVGLSVTAGAFLAAATAGSMVTVAPAKADILDSILDPILQPIVTSLTDAVGAVDPAAATDLTSLFDMSGLSLSSIDPAAAVSQATQFDTALNALFGANLFGTGAAQPAAAAAASVPCATSGDCVIPMPTTLGTEPYVDVSVNGGLPQPVLVDTGSSGLVIPIQNIGWWNLATLGFPVGQGVSGYSGGVEYYYLTFNTPVSFDNPAGAALATTTGSTQVEVPIVSWPTSFAPGTPLNLQQFFADDGVNGILGIGVNTPGPSVSPITALPGDLSQGVLVDVPQNELILGPNALSLPGEVSTPGAPVSDLLVSINGGAAQSVPGAFIDSGGVYGTIPSSVVGNLGNSGTLPVGTTITVENASHQVLYSYVVDSTNSPTVTSGGPMDTGYVPFSQAPIYIDYSPSGTGTTDFYFPPPTLS